MSFICAKCKTVSHGSVRMVPVAGREKEYWPREVYLRDGTLIHDRGGVGWEIEREIAVCGGCEPSVKRYMPPRAAITITTDGEVSQTLSASVMNSARVR